MILYLSLQFLKASRVILYKTVLFIYYFCSPLQVKIKIDDTDPLNSSYFLLQRLPIVKETLPSLPSAMIQTQDSGCLMILTSGSVILVTLELMFSWVMLESAKV